MSFVFRTKAETLLTLKPRLTLSSVPHSLFVTVHEWQTARESVLALARSAFGDALVAVRSSSHGEDCAFRSMAGAFVSVLNIRATDAAALTEAVQKVARSLLLLPDEQILIQAMVSGVCVSGVVMTQDLDSGAPYYVVNYDDESGRTDTVTGGTGVNKTVFVHRRRGGAWLESPRIRQILTAVQEIERVVGNDALDIEFAMSRGDRVSLLQVRQIVTRSTWNQDIVNHVDGALAQVTETLQSKEAAPAGVVGHGPVYGEMPDWNPAEMIGTSPHRLAASLYRRLITDSVWRVARAKMGYFEPRDQPLMLMLGGHPFIDVRNSFNSFLPAEVSIAIADRLVTAWLDRLRHRPEFHDKVEFEVAQTAYDFCLQSHYDERYADVLRDDDRVAWEQALLSLTNRAIAGEGPGSLGAATARVEALERRQMADRDVTGLRGAHILLDEAAALGTEPFAIIARHAFIAESLLRSLVAAGLMTEDRVSAFKGSLETVAGRLVRDMAAVRRGLVDVSLFMRQYGHLRPGTYDILSPRYDRQQSVFELLKSPDGWRAESTPPDVPDGVATPSEAARIDRACRAIGFTFDAAALFRYARRAILGREWSKFVFSRSVSDALEFLAEWGNAAGLSREQLSHLSIDEIFATESEPSAVSRERLSELARRAEEQHQVTRVLRLPHLIRNANDLFVIPLHRSAPNFVTNKTLLSEIVELQPGEFDVNGLEGKIVCIENADPGFDWVFSCKIAGLITKYGGANSHMAIRCAEFALPAAIGCGEQVYQRLLMAKRVELNCADHVLRPLFSRDL